MYHTVKGFLRTEGQIFVNEEGEEVVLRGMGVANWLNPEGFLFGGGFFGGTFGDFARSTALDRGRTLDMFVTELCGAAYQKEFWKKWTENYFAEEDIRAMKEEGFNSVRFPLDARFILKEEPGYQFNEEHLALLDRCIDLCEKYGLYVILDLHAASYGQTAASCDDGVDNMPHLFTDEEGEERTIRVWTELASRYADRWIVAGYDLLNEPIVLPKWDYLIPDLKDFYDRLIAAIREVDKRHILFIQGHRFAGRMDIFDHDYDPVGHNWSICIHTYETAPDLALLGPILAIREEWNVPVWVGECGGSDPACPINGNEWMAAFFELLLEYHISYNIWCSKAIENCDAAYTFSYKGPADWQKIMDYCDKGLGKPSYEKAIAIFDELVENMRFENCTEAKDRIPYMLKTPGCTVPARAYDADREHHGTWPYALFCGFRREDRMHLVYEPGYVHADIGVAAMLSTQFDTRVKYGDWAHIWLQLDEGDAACYSVREAAEPVPVVLQICGEPGAQIRVTDGEKVLYEGGVPETDLPESLAVGSAGTGERVTVKVESTCGSVVMKTVEFH